MLPDGARGDRGLRRPAAGRKWPQMWEQDCSAATENILIEAELLGLGAVWLGVHPLEERVEGLRALLGIPEDVVPFAVVAARLAGASARRPRTGTTPRASTSSAGSGGRPSPAASRSSAVCPAAGRGYFR